MSEIARIRQKIVQDVFDYQSLHDVLSSYKKPRDKITRLLAAGDIIRIKKGLYIFGEPFRRGAVDKGYLANLIYGPSYVSLDYALCRYGFIPERVETVTSVTTRRSRLFHTPLGLFSYRTLSDNRYAVGAGLQLDTENSFLIAVPEKALADKVWADKRFSGRSMSEYRSYLGDDLRIAEDVLLSLNRSRMREIVMAYDSAKIKNLALYLRSLEESTSA